MATPQATLTPIWYLARVRQVVGMLHRPLGGHDAFTIAQQVFFWPLGDGEWMVFDGKWLYTILDTAEAIASLTSCRDSQAQVLLAPHQDLLTERFYQAVGAQGRGFVCRPRS